MSFGNYLPFILFARPLVFRLNSCIVFSNHLQGMQHISDALFVLGSIFCGLSFTATLASTNSNSQFSETFCSKLALGRKPGYFPFFSSHSHALPVVQCLKSVFLKMYASSACLLICSGESKTGFSYSIMAEAPNNFFRFFSSGIKCS